MRATAILIIIEGRETASDSFWYQFTTGKPLGKPWNRPSIIMRMALLLTTHTKCILQNNWLSDSVWSEIERLFISEKAGSGRNVQSR